MTGHSIDRPTFAARTCRSGAIVAVLAVVLLAPGLAHACAVCYGAADSAMTDGMNNGILVLLAIVAAVQIGFVVLFLSIRKRSQRLHQRKQRFQVIQGGVG